MKVKRAMRALQIILTIILIVNVFSGCGKLENPLAPPVSKTELAPKVKKIDKPPKGIKKEMKKKEKQGLDQAFLKMKDKASDTAVKRILEKLLPYATTLTPAGAVVTSSDGIVTLEIPAGAVDDTVSIFIVEGKLKKKPRGELKTRIYSLQPEGLQFLKPVTLKFNYPAYLDEFELKPAYFDEEKFYWIYLPFTRDEVGRVITTQINHFSTYALIDPAPSAPTDLAGSVNNDGTIFLRWKAPRDPDIVGYNIYRDGVKINNKLIIDETYLDVALIDGQEYTYEVTAVDGSGNESPRSNAYIATAIDEVAPPVPSYIIAYSETTVNYVNWDTVTSPDLAGFKVVKNPGDKLITTDGLIQEQSIVDPNNSVLDKVWYTIYVYDINGNYSYANSNEVLTMSEEFYAAAKPNPPENLRGTVGDRQVTLEWDEVQPANSEQEIIGYNIYMDGNLIGSVPASETSFDYTVENGVAHTYEVRTYAKLYALYYSESDPSNSVTLTARDDVPPAAPSNLNVATVGDNFVKLYWDVSRDYDVVGYNVYVDDVFYGFVVDPYITVSGLVNNRDYSFYVKSLDSSGNESLPSNTVIAQSTDMEIPPAPYDLQIVDTGDNYLKLSWLGEKPLDFAGYRIYRDGIYITTVMTEEYLDEGLVNLQTYTYQVSMIDDDANESDFSNLASGTPFDNVAPAQVEGLKSTLYDRDVLIEWNPILTNEDGSVCKDLVKYRVIKEAKGLRQEWILEASITQLYDTGLQYDVIYNYYVSGIDDDGNEGLASTIEVIPKDQIPPAAPTGLSYIPDYSEIHLSWAQNTESDLAGYNVYRNGIKVNVDLITTEQYTDAGLEAGNSYTYYITAVDIRGNESAPSDTVVASTYQTGQRYNIWSDGTAIGSTGNSPWAAFDTSKFYIWTGSASTGHIVLAIDDVQLANPDYEYQTKADEFDVIIKFPEVRRVSRIYYNGDGYEYNTFDYEVYYGLEDTEYDNLYNALTGVTWNLVPAPNATGSDGNYRIQLYPGVALYEWDPAEQDIKLDAPIYTKYIRFHFKRTSAYSVFINYVFIYN